MSRPRLEVADIFDRHGAAWRRANAGHVSLGQLQVMSAIVSCRTAALGGHVTPARPAPIPRSPTTPAATATARSVREAAARDWLAEREADLLSVPYFHVVFTLPAAIADLAYQNEAVIYDALFKASSEALLTIAADPKHLGARIGITAVLHTWGHLLVELQEGGLEVMLVGKVLKARQLVDRPSAETILTSRFAILRVPAVCSRYGGRPGATASLRAWGRELATDAYALAGCGNKLAMRLISFFCGVKHGFGGLCEAFGAAV